MGDRSQFCDLAAVVVVSNRLGFEAAAGGRSSARRQGLEPPPCAFSHTPRSNVSWFTQPQRPTCNSFIRFSGLCYRDPVLGFSAADWSFGHEMPVVPQRELCRQQVLLSLRHGSAIRCPSCKHLVEAESRFCSMCGHPLGEKLVPELSAEAAAVQSLSSGRRHATVMFTDVSGYTALTGTHGSRGCASAS